MLGQNVVNPFVDFPIFVSAGGDVVPIVLLVIGNSLDVFVGVQDMVE